MIHIPPDVKIPICIERGSVFNFYIDFKDSSRESKNRYFVVLNRNPKSDIVLLMLTPTTKINKVKMLIQKSKINEKTVVEIRAGEYCALNSDCIFNCNNVFEVKMENLIEKVREGGSMNYPKMPDEIVKHLVVGVKESPNVSQEFKSLL